MAASSVASSLFLSLRSPSKPNNRRSINNFAISRKFTRVCASSSSSFRNGGSKELSECPVPAEQQPVNEYQSLATSFMFSWAAAELPEYASRLAVTGIAFAILVGLPVAAFGVRDPVAHVPRCALGATAAGLVAVTLAVLRMYLGWAYVGNRLLSATVEYEETGWYDGQVWVKTPEVLARDRLLGSFSVKPILKRVKVTLIGLALSLVVCVLLFVNVENPRETEDINVRAIAGAYNDASARSFEPDAFCATKEYKHSNSTETWLDSKTLTKVSSRYSTVNLLDAIASGRRRGLLYDSDGHSPLHPHSREADNFILLCHPTVIFS